MNANIFNLKSYSSTSIEDSMWNPLLNSKYWKIGILCILLQLFPTNDEWSLILNSIHKQKVWLLHPSELSFLDMVWFVLYLLLAPQKRCFYGLALNERAIESE